MGLTREQIKSKFNEMLGMVTPENQATATELMTSLNDEFDGILTENEQYATKNQELTANNEKLRSVNADLFLKVGVTDKRGTPTEEPDDVPEAISYDTLFNEKGDLL